MRQPTEPDHTVSPVGEELWRPAPGFEGIYDVSSQGRVRCWVAAGGHRRRTPRIKTPQANTRSDYFYVVLGSRHRYKAWTVHRLVLSAFVGPQPPSVDACHLNGDKADNRLTNLVWASRQENERHKRRHGRVAMGERNGQSKLTAADVSGIRTMLRKGHTQQSIAAKYGVTQGNVSAIKRGLSWRDEGAHDAPNEA